MMKTNETISTTPKSSPRRMESISRSPSSLSNTPSRDNNDNSHPQNAAAAITSPSRVGAERDSSCVQVAVRVRPVLTWEKKECVCQAFGDSSSIQIGGSNGPRFTFDRVFDPSTTQAQLYQHAVAPLIHKCLQGYNATIFAYGQTGSGKTHTILVRQKSDRTELIKRAMTIGR